jgi:PAS domain S-box-containing protein
MNLLERLDQLEFVHRTASLTSWVWDVHNDRVQWFGEPEGLFGLEPGSYSGRFPDYLSLLHPEDAPQARQTYVDCLTGARPAYRSEERLLRRDGSVRWLECFGRAEYGEGGRAVRMAGVVRDITERRRAEERIRELNERLEERVRLRTAELEAANRELDCFSLSVSHDLLAPVRNITAFARVLLQDCRNSLGADLLGMLRRIEHSAQRMDQMVHGLLDLSRAGRAQLDLQPLDMSALAAEASEDLRLAYRYAGELRVPEMDFCLGDARLLRQVLQNLIGNAMKFSRGAARPLIELSSSRLESGQVEYCVRDNGCGFNMNYAARLFGTFQRLHSAAHYEGNGVGLSTVKRIVERHGGAVRAEGKVGQGAAFFFCLPGI